MRKLCVVFLSVFLFACVPAGKSLTESARIGTDYEKEITLGSKVIPLPPGQWKVIASGISGDFFKVYLLKEHTGKKFSYITIKVESLQVNRKWGYNSSNYFNRTNMHFAKVYSNTNSLAQDAWAINHIIIHFDEKPDKPVLSQACKYLKENNYVISDVMIGVAHRFTGKHVKERFLVVNYYYNPEAEGIIPVPKSNWTTSDWHKMRISKDPQKVAFIEKLKIDHTEMHEKIRQGLGDYY